MNLNLTPGDKVIWHKTDKGCVSSSQKIPAEVYYKPSRERVAIRFRDKIGDQIIRFVPPESLEKLSNG